MSFLSAKHTAMLNIVVWTLNWMFLRVNVYLGRGCRCKPRRAAWSECALVVDTHQHLLSEAQAHIYTHTHRHTISCWSKSLVQAYDLPSLLAAEPCSYWTRQNYTPDVWKARCRCNAPLHWITNALPHQTSINQSVSHFQLQGERREAIAL